MSIKWKGETETWKFPMTTEQLERIGRPPVQSDDEIDFIAVAPAYAYCEPNLYLDLPQGEQSLQDQLWSDCENGSEFVIRFGEMSRDEFDDLQEHDGW